MTTGDAMTVEKVLAAARLIPRVPELPRLVFTVNALTQTKERLFPESKNRSRRIRKKLIKRFGGEFRIAPSICQFGDTIYAHPSFEEKFKAQLQERMNSDLESAIFRGIGSIGVTRA